MFLVIGEKLPDYFTELPDFKINEYEGKCKYFFKKRLQKQR